MEWSMKNTVLKEEFEAHVELVKRAAYKYVEDNKEEDRLEYFRLKGACNVLRELIQRGNRETK
jgi:hypothetical protein